MNKSVALLKNSTQYIKSELNTIVYGKCHKLCYQKTVHAQESAQLDLKRDKDYIVYTLGAEEEFWLQMPSR